MRFLVWGAGAIGGTLGAYLARAGHDVTFVDTVAEHVSAIDARRHLGSPGRSPSSSQLRAGVHAGRAAAAQWDTIILATKAHHTEAAIARAAPALERRRLRRLGAERAQRARDRARSSATQRTVGVVRELRRGLHRAGRHPLRRPRRGGASVRSTGAVDVRASRPFATRGCDFDDRAIVTPNIWGYLWGKEAYGAMLFATALTNESIADALAMPALPRPLHRAGARDPRRRARRAASRRKRSTASIPSAYLPTAPDGAAARVARRARRAQSAIGQDAQRHLARPRGAQAANRGRCAARHRRRRSGARPACRRRSPRGWSS